MSNELTYFEKLDLRILLSNEIDKNKSTIELYSKLKDMSKIIEYNIKKNEQWELLIAKLENNATV
jgi:hypothetical protein